jgi:hypothetical protein
MATKIIIDYVNGLFQNEISTSKRTPTNMIRQFNNRLFDRLRMEY